MEAETIFDIACAMEATLHQSLDPRVCWWLSFAV
jgi:hypothetical protein